jgi:hypothetical protein
LECVNDNSRSGKLKKKRRRGGMLEEDEDGEAMM